MDEHLQELKRGGRHMTKTEIKLNNLNKGIDELIKKYEDKITIYTESDILVKEIITDLKALKGE